MNILILGSGGREHTFAYMISKAVNATSFLWLPEMPVLQK